MFPLTVKAVAKPDKPLLHFFFGGDQRHPDVIGAGVYPHAIARQIGPGQNPNARVTPQFQRRNLAIFDGQPQEKAALWHGKAL